jgi:hypothetical protein
MRLLDKSTSSVKSGPSVQRVVAMLIVLTVFLIQLFAVDVHHHAIADDDSDCPTCQVVVDTPSVPPSGALAVTPESPGQSYLAHLPQYRSNTQSPTFLTPPSHAPPVFAV